MRAEKIGNQAENLNFAKLFVWWGTQEKESGQDCE